MNTEYSSCIAFSTFHHPEFNFILITKKMQSGYYLSDLVQEAQTRWLKPPEVLFILQNYEDHQLTDKPPQKPASGSLFRFNKRVLRFFRKDGHSWRRKKDGRTVGEAHERLKVLGTPTREEIKCMNPNYTEFKFPQIKAHPWHKIFHKRMPPEAVDLVSRLLQYSPNLRSTALDALMHPFFDELRDPNTRLPNGRFLPPLFNFKSHELKKVPTEMLGKLIPEHARKQSAFFSS